MSSAHRLVPSGGRRRIAVASATLVVVALGAVGFVVTADDSSEQTVRADKAGSSSARSDPSPTPALARQVARPIGDPDRLVIPAIGVDAPVVPVGTADTDAQDVPTSLAETGWWRDGRQPGQHGNAVIVGHTASKANGVFDDLADLDRGDTLTISSGKKTLTYAVTGEQEVAVEKFADVADAVYRTDGPSGIVLMTCGDWNGTRFETTVIIRARLAS